MTTRAEHLAWCKQRALAELAAGDEQGAVSSMISDLGKWAGGDMYRPEVLALVGVDGMYRRGADQVRNWIEGFT